MQVIEKTTDGLMREFNVVVSAAAIEQKVAARLNEVGQTVRLPGFRPGKVPMDMLRKRFGQSVRGEVLQSTIDESTQAALIEKAFKPALQPKIELVSFDEGKDLEFAVKVEVLPEIVPNDFGGLALTREVAAVEEAAIDDGLAEIRKSRSTTEPLTEARAAANGDVLIADFAGTVDGVAFEGGTAEGATIELGSNTFIPGFEEQLVGAKIGEATQVKVTFPADYPAANLAGKDAAFDVTVKELQRRVLPDLDEAFAKQMGVDDVATLRNRTRDALQEQYNRVTRMRLKRQLLDKLAEGHTFPVPQGMVDAEFDGIWRQVEQAKKEDQLDASDLSKSDDELKAEYRGIAERRVRLGLLLSDIGQKNNLSVAPEDFSKAIMDEARRYPGQESAVVNYYQRNQQALESLRAPIFEEKVVDFILTKAQITDLSVSAEDLSKEPDAA